jgi:hypothetical protein
MQHANSLGVQHANSLGMQHANSYNKTSRVATDLNTSTPQLLADMVSNFHCTQHRYGDAGASANPNLNPYLNPYLNPNPNPTQIR